MTGSRSSSDAAQHEAIEQDLDAVPCDSYGILGVEVRLRTDSPQVREFFARAYRWFPLRRCSRALDLAAVFEPRSGANPFAMAGDEIIDLSGSPSPENRAFLFLLESIMDRIDGSIVLHAGSVAYDGRGVILAGPAFAGKSTLVRELLGRGFDFLSDDAAPIDRGTGLLLPYPRAVGIRKPAEGNAVASDLGLPEAGVHELPYRWLVDPASMGARLPAYPCAPALIFHLDPWVPEEHETPGRRTFEIAFADEVARETIDLGALSPFSSEDLPGRPFPGRRVVLERGSTGSASALAALWRSHRREILYVEEVRAEERTGGPPAIEACPISTLLLPLVRDVLNRGEDGLLMDSHGGRVTSLAVELGALLKNVRAYRVTSGSAGELADGIAQIAAREIHTC